MTANPTDGAPDLSGIDLTTLSSEHAGEFLQKMTAAYNANNRDPFKMTPEAATAQLKALAKNPQPPADPLDAAVDGTLTIDAMPALTDGGLTPYKLLSVVEELRSIGLDDGVIKEAIEPERYKVTREEMQKVVQLQGELFGDKEWVRRLLDGGEKERRQFTLIEIVLGHFSKA